MYNRLTLLIAFNLCLTSILIAQSPQLITDFNSSPDDSYNEFNYKGAAIGESLVFPIVSSDMGEELGVLYDGTISVLKDIRSGAASSGPKDFILNGDMIYFVANDGVNGGALWTTDGTEQGTQLVYDPSSSTSGTLPSGLILSKSGTIYFSYRESLYRYKNGQGEKLMNNVELGMDRRHGDFNYCHYNDEIAFVRLINRSDLDLVAVEGDTTRILESIKNTSGFSDVFGLNQTRHGLVFGVRDAFVAEVHGTYLYNAQSEELKKVTIADTTADRIHNFNDETSLILVRDQGYYNFDGTQASLEELFDSKVPTLTQGEPINRAISGNNIVFEAINNDNDRELIYSDGTAAGSMSLMEIPEYNSDFLSKDHHAFIATGTSNLFRPTLQYVDLRDGSTKSLHDFADPSNMTKSIQLVGILNGDLVFLSNLDQTVGKEMYILELDFISDTDQFDDSESPFQLDFYSNQVACNGPSSEKVEFQLISINGSIIHSFEGVTNTKYDLDHTEGLNLVIAKIGNKVLSGKYVK